MLGLDYLSDIGQWRSYCSVEDRIMKGNFNRMQCAIYENKLIHIHHCFYEYEKGDLAYADKK